MNSILSKIKKNNLEFTFIIILLTISAFSHGINMLHYPYFESDEGTYLSQAWSVISNGKLAPYTYWYDHAPIGWLFSAIWLMITGGLLTFGFALNSGRIFMFIIHILTTLLIYLFARKLTGSKIPGSIAVLIFSLSPLAIYFQRRLLLDNIMIFWFFLSLCLILYSRKKLRYIHLSAIVTGIAILSKESAIFFLPFITYLVYFYTDRRNRIFAVTSWLSITFSIIAIYFLYSFLKGELMPSGTLLGGTNEHVSLLGTLNFQNNRGKIPIWNSSSSFWNMLRTWKDEDPFIILTGIWSSFIILLFSLKYKSGRIIGFLNASYWLFLLRGGLVLEFYVVPLIPLLSLTIGYVIWQSISVINNFLSRFRLQNFSYLLLVPLFCIFISNIYYYSTHFRIFQNIYKSDQTTAQIAAVNWVLSKNEPYNFYAIDNYAYLDLNYRNNNNFKRADYYWKIDGDKDIKNKILQNNANNIDYILFTPTIGGDLGTGELHLIGSAMSQSQPITSFTGDGWYVQIWGVKNSKRILTSSWESYKKSFIENGRNIDPYQNNMTSSEVQSYALLRSVWQNDKTTFDKVWDWTKTNLKQKNELLFSKWNYGSVKDTNSASDADEDTALALLFAYKKWGNVMYLNESKKIIYGIWQNDVIQINNKPYLTAGNWAHSTSEIIINPSYLAPANYRLFAEIDSKRPWTELANTSYDILKKCTLASLDKQNGVLPTEWCAINKTTEKVTLPADEFKSSDYSNQALRIPFRVGLDYRWFQNYDAKQYLMSLSLLDNEWKKNKKLATAYTHDGKIWENYESVTSYAENLSYFSVIDTKTAHTIYTQKIESKFFEGKDISYWEDPKNVNEQNWTWFGTGLYANLLPNLWNDKLTTVTIK